MVWKFKYTYLEKRAMPLFMTKKYVYLKLYYRHYKKLKDITNMK